MQNPKFRYNAIPIRAYRIVQTIGNTWPGGTNGGLLGYGVTEPAPIPLIRLLRTPTTVGSAKANNEVRKFDFEFSFIISPAYNIELLYAGFSYS